ncbi:hypothetical protein Tco_0157204 [Tanacetum coccineum]
MWMMMSALEESRGINLAWVIAEHLCKHASSLKENSLICGGHYVTKISHLLGYLNEEEVAKYSEPIEHETWTLKMLANELYETNHTLMQTEQEAPQPGQRINPTLPIPLTNHQMFHHTGIGYRQKDKNKAKSDKTEHETRKEQDTKAEGVYILNGPTQEQAAKVSSQYWKPPIFYDDDDDDDEESSIPLRDIISKLPLSVAIVPDLPIMDSLIMEDEHLNTIPETKSNEENESREKSVTFSNPLFNSSDDFTSSDDESLSDEDVPEDNVKIYSNPLFEFEDEYIFSDVNPLFDEVLKNIESKDSYVSNLDEPALLVTPLSNFNEDECFDPGGDVDEIEFLLHHDPSTPKISVASILEGFTDEPPLDEIDAFLDMDISTDIENGYHDSKGDIIYLESLLIYDTTPNLTPEVFLDHDPRSLKDELDKEDLKSMVKVFDPGIYENTFLQHILSFGGDHYGAHGDGYHAGYIVPSSGYEIGGSLAGFQEEDFDPIVHSKDCVESDDDEMRD